MVPGLDAFRPMVGFEEITLGYCAHFLETYGSIRFDQDDAVFGGGDAGDEERFDPARENLGGVGPNRAGEAPVKLSGSIREMSSLWNIVVEELGGDPPLLRINDRFDVRRDSFERMTRANLPPDVITIACLEEHFRAKLLNEEDSARRDDLYREAYTELGVIHAMRGQVGHGLSEAVVEFIWPLIRGKRVLELGCGFGLMAARVSGHVSKYTGIDASAKCVEIARERASALLDANFILHSVSSPLEIGQKYEVVYSNDFFEHLHQKDVDAALELSNRALEDGGMLITITSNRNFGPFDVSRTYLQLGEPARGLHLSETTYGEISRRLTAHGFESIITPLIPLRVYLKLKRQTTLARFLCGSTRIKSLLERTPIINRTVGPYLGLTSVIVCARKKGRSSP